jgi:hypothetical protein
MVELDSLAFISVRCVTTLPTAALSGVLFLLHTVTMTMQSHCRACCYRARVRCAGEEASRSGQVCMSGSLSRVSPMITLARSDLQKTDWGPSSKGSRRTLFVFLVPFGSPSLGLLLIWRATRLEVVTHRNTDASLLLSACRGTEGAGQPRGERGCCRCSCGESKIPANH